ncbi:MAG TPA: Na+/H+ antiporter [Verrucomicrobiae bacterium]|jgi:CPA1 family monovalent cation:H+ antiporter|nr:Na+/H+ antiporter [Verrucomicrobiae bacterium]
MYGTIDIFVGMLLAVAALALIARRLHIPYPILFVIGGLMLGLIPGVPRVHLNPELVFLFCLPPLLYPAALFTSWRDFRANLRPISLLAVGLVLITTVAIALLAHHFMHLPLAAGFVLGAIVSPPDAIAATAIAERLRVPRRIVTILEGESLVNDATALVAYRFAIIAVATGSFSLGHASVQFFVVCIGGFLVGLAVGRLAEWFHKRVQDAPIEITVSLLTPFAAYLTADRLGVSGVLAVVTAGLYLGWRLPEITDFKTRLDARPVWDMVEFVLNGFVFILIGLQLPTVRLAATGGDNLPKSQLILYALLISVAVIVVRILWVFPATYLPRLLFKKIREKDPCPSWRHVVIVAWTGMRGVVSLAAAMALPETKDDGSAFPGRDLIVFLSFVIIMATLVVQGLSLPPLIRWLGVEDDDSLEHEERKARLAANKAALARLDQIAEHGAAKADALKRLRIEYEDRINQLEATEPDHNSRRLRLFSEEYERLSREGLKQERETILQLRNKEVINDEVLRRIQQDIDLAEARL